MKLIVIGSAPQAHVCLSSQYVSGYHAEIIQLDNGEMLLLDKNSTNGTFVNGSRIAPNVEIPINRGMQIVFADAPLDWQRIPEVVVDPDITKYIGIGSHQKNKVHLGGDKVSRFHATIIQKKDGKWYIRDHSTNGTTINGVRLARDIYVRLKRGDVIKCAGQPLANPIGEGRSGHKLGIIAGISAGVVAVACLIIFLIGPLSFEVGDDVIYKSHNTATVFVVTQYHYRVTAKDLDVSRILKCPEDINDFILDKNGYLVPYQKGENVHNTSATGFFISKDGYFVTNLHVARPWLFNTEIEEIEKFFKSCVYEASQYYSNSDMAQIMACVDYLKVEGVIDQILIVPSNQYFDLQNAIICSEVAVSKEKNVDLAICKVRKGQGSLPEGATYVDLNSIPSDSFYQPGKHLFSIGYPLGTGLQDYEDKTLQAKGVPGAINGTTNDISFGYDASTTFGSSGSPVFNSKQQLIGIVSSGYEGTQFGNAVRAKYVVRLLKDNSIVY